MLRFGLGTSSTSKEEEARAHKTADETTKETTRQKGREIERERGGE
jgi:hypothetical protein